MNVKWRLRIISLFFSFAGLMLISRLFYWQVMASDQLLNLAQSQQQTILAVSANRGEIIFNDASLLVANQPAYLAYLVTKDHLFESKALAEKLAPILYPALITSATPSADLTDSDKKSLIEQSREILLPRLSDPNLNWIALARKITSEQKQSLAGLGFPGINFEAEQTRFYPEASMAAHLIGFVGQDSQGKDIGYHGLEGFYQTELAGRTGIIRQENDAFQQPILFSQSFEQEPRDGRQLKLNLDKSLQFLVERKLRSGIEQFGAKAGSITIMDPFTGAILAMASLPAYSPQEYKSYQTSLFLNPVVAEAFEPGSIFKIFVMAAAIDNQVIKPDTICDICDGPVKIDKYMINTWDNQYRPNETITDILVHSDNVGMVFVGQKLGLDKFLAYFKNFGFTENTGIDLQDEQTPKAKPDNKWTYVDLATASFGQGFVVTGMQLLQAASAIANGGELVQPQVVSQVIGDRQIVTFPVKIKQRVISSDTARQVADMMVAAAKDGEAKWTNVKGYRIAGKTGTAQVAMAGKYSAEKTNASFIGFAPAEKPKFVMLVTLKEPSTSQWASETAAPLWFSLSQDLLNHFNIIPSQN